MADSGGGVRVSRRGVIKAGLLGTAIAALGGVSLALRPSRVIKPRAGLRVLTDRQYAVLTVVAERLCPATKTQPGARAIDVAALVDQRLVGAEKDTQAAIGMLLDVFENALTGALFGERLAPFTQLNETEQNRVLAQWRASTVGFRRSVFGALNGLISSTYFGDARTWPGVGYAGPPSPQALRVGFAMNLVDYESLRASQRPAKG
jgi:hypothetical protein